MAKHRKPQFPQDIFNPDRNLLAIRSLSQADRDKAKAKFAEMFRDTDLPGITLSSGFIPPAPYTAKLS